MGRRTMPLGKPILADRSGSTDNDGTRTAPRSKARKIKLGLLALLCFLATATPIWLVARSHADFDYTHAWVSAHHATMARAFTENGIFSLHGVPVENNAPLTTQPDFYIDWPPLFDIALSLLDQMIGGEPRHLHLAMAFLSVVIAGTIGAGLSRTLGQVPAIIASATYLLEPITLKYGFGLFHVQLALAFTIGSLLSWCVWTDTRRKMFLALSSGLMGLAILTSWEPVLSTAGIVATILLWERDRRRSVQDLLIISGTALVTLSIVAVQYGLAVPWTLDQLYAKAMQQSGRSGFAITSRPHGLKDFEAADPHRIPLRQILGTFWHRARMVGDLALFSLVTSIPIGMARSADARYRRALGFFIPLASIWVLWMVLMWKHYYIHEYETLIAAPPAAVAVGIFLAFLQDVIRTSDSSRRRAYLQYAALAVFAVVIIAGARGIFFSALQDRSGSAQIAFGNFIRSNVPEGSIVLTNESSMVPMYYARRHLVQGLADGEMIRAHRQAIASLCPSCNFYLAIPNDRTQNFNTLIGGDPPLASDGISSVYQLNL